MLNALLTSPKSAGSVPLTSTQPSAAMVTTSPAPELVQYLTKGEYQPKISHITSKAYNVEHDEHKQYGPRDTTQRQEQLNQTSQRPDFSGSEGYSQHHQGHDSHIHDSHSYEAPVLEVDIQKPESSSSIFSDVISSLSDNRDIPAEAGKEQIHTQEVHAASADAEQKPPPFEPSMSSWDAQRSVLFCD